MKEAKVNPNSSAVTNRVILAVFISHRTVIASPEATRREMRHSGGRSPQLTKARRVSVVLRRLGISRLCIQSPGIQCRATGVFV